MRVPVGLGLCCKFRLRDVDWVCDDGIVGVRRVDSVERLPDDFGVGDIVRVNVERPFVVLYGLPVSQRLKLCGCDAHGIVEQHGVGLLDSHCVADEDAHDIGDAVHVPVADAVDLALAYTRHIFRLR